MYASKRIHEFIIKSNVKVNNEFCILELYSEVELPKMYPGQFVEAKINDSPNTFLRRPFSIHDIDYENHIIKLLIQIVGDGTRKLAELKINNSINLIFPLGNSFSIIPNEEVILIGGGCGVAPLLLLAKEMANQGNYPKILIGGRNKDYLLEVEEYKRYGNVFLTTEDGSEGEKGFVIHHSILWEEPVSFKRIYACGPEAMMKAIAKYSKKKGIECEVSLENLMACGVGACLCCVVETNHGNVCTCTEGPVFNTKDLKW